ncbi:hypothetical protein EV426DRAFT_625867 [Tirmania nivea]|nr:hypothetical protein EV426DRAFT_625867 [Tirmania nivea]
MSALGKRHDLELRAKALRKASTINTTFILKQLFKLADVATADKDAVIDVLGNVIQKADTAVEVMTAGDATAQKLSELFDLQLDEPRAWSLRRTEHRTLPSKDLQYMYQKLKRAGYDKASEATSRIRIDLMMVEARVVVLDLIREEQKQEQEQESCDDIIPDLGGRFSISNDGTVDNSIPPVPHPPLPRKLRPSTPQKRKPQELLVYPELDISVEIVDNRHFGHPKKMRITGKADWGLAYGTRTAVNHGSALIAIEAKSEATFTSARYQLVTYLAIMQQLRRQNENMNDFVQGFFSDGYQYVFMAIDNKNAVLQSRVYDCRFDRDIHLIFSWIVSLLRAAAKTSPKTSPTKKDTTRYNEIHDFNNNVFVKVYNDKDEVMGEDEDEDEGDDTNVCLPQIVVT